MRNSTITYINEKFRRVFPTFKTFEKDVLIPNGFKEHHTSLARGYQTTKFDRAEKYEGRFGTGWKVFSNNPESSRYMFVTYYVKER